MSAPSPDLLRRLRLELGETAEILDDSKLARAMYSTDASIYRIPPAVVAHPRTRDEVIALVRAALAVGMPITARGAGTSCAGNAVGPGLVIDVSRHLRTIHSIDPEARTAVVDPGVVQETLQQAARPHRLRLGPDPSTSTRCTVGGMIGNNACGPRALGYGRMSDNVVALEVITGTGEILHLGTDDVPDLRSLVAGNLGIIRTQFGRFGRQVSGYSMEHLLPEKDFDLPRFFAGTEGTLGIILSATVRLAPDAPERVMVALGYPSMADAGDDISNLLSYRPVACEGLDRRIVDVVIAKRGADAVGTLPAGDGWMFIELVGDDPVEVRGRADALLAAAASVEGWVVTDPSQAADLWQVRADGAGLAGVSLADPAYPGWEDAAVPPERLGNYLRDFDALLERHNLHALPYGHFGDGCVHARIDFPLTSEGGAAKYRAFVVEAAKLVASHGGSMSGEHGDGRARSELLQYMYTPEALELFGAVKDIFDPQNLLNPGVLVDPAPVDADVRAVAITSSPLNLTHPNFVKEVHKCSGVGKCIADNAPSGGVMCPSFQATRNEKDSTRGRSRVLQEMINGTLIGGWRSPEVHEALDLCLSCKGCARDCPTGVDMAAYKARVTHETWKGRLRPRNHYALGWLPRWGRMITTVPGLGSLVNIVGQTPGLGRLLRWGAGVDARRDIPRFAGRNARGRLAALTDAASRELPVSRDQMMVAGNRGDASPARPAADMSTLPTPKGPVLVWVDSFSDCFESTTFAATVQVLVRLGYEPRVLERTACCGLTWISTGQLDGAKRQLTKAAAELAPVVAAGIPIVGLEPSCTAVWRSDAPELLPDDKNVAALNGTILTLAEFLAGDGEWRSPTATTPPSSDGTPMRPFWPPRVPTSCELAAVAGWPGTSASRSATMRFLSPCSNTICCPQSQRPDPTPSSWLTASPARRS